jgi:hypothetical protein
MSADEIKAKEAELPQNVDEAEIEPLTDEELESVAGGTVVKSGLCIPPTTGVGS